MKEADKVKWSEFKHLGDPQLLEEYEKANSLADRFRERAEKIKCEILLRHYG